MSAYKNFILDSSAFIAFIAREAGCEMVGQVIEHAIMSAVNVSEVTKFLIEHRGYEQKNARDVIEHLLNDIVPFNTEQAYLAAYLYAETKALGLSLGDRACIAAGIATGLPVLTADRAWKEANLEQVEIILIR